MLSAKLFKALGVVLLSLASLLSGAAPVWAAPPANDNFASATVVNTFPFSDDFMIDEATTEPGEPIESYCYWLRQTVWYKFTLPADTVIQIDPSASYYGAIGLILVEATGPTFNDFNLVDCNYYGGRVTFYARTGVTYYLQIGSLGTDGNGTGMVNLNMTVVPPPANDNFANPTAVTTLPFAEEVDITGATREPGEPLSCCDYAYGSVWYRFHATNEQLLSAFAYGPFFKEIGIYTGNTLADLTKVASSAWSDMATFKTLANTTYYIQVSSLNPVATPLSFELGVTPPPQADFYFSPADPSIFDNIQFTDSSGDPGGIGIQECQWRFGDKKSATGCAVAHTYPKDGSYTAELKVITVDGRSGSTTQLVAVKTHDIAITKFTRPSSARAGHTYKLMVGISNKRYPEQVQVELLKSTPQGYEQVGLLNQRVPVRSGSRTTDFYFSYTFTDADASVGKVSFKAIATILNGRDALPADNEFISFPTKVTPKSSHDRVVAAEMGVEEMANYVTDTVSNPLGIDAEVPAPATPERPVGNNRLFIPVVSKAE